jgi:hypothetical protein
MIGLTNEQLTLLMRMAGTLPVNLRDDFLRCVAQQLEATANRDLEDTCRRALAFVQVHAPARPRPLKWGFPVGGFHGEEDEKTEADTDAEERLDRD